MNASPLPTDPRFIDLTGQRFGRWTVLHFVDRVRRQGRWLCRCDCGAESVVLGLHLRGGKSASCGCRTGVSVKIGQRYGCLEVVARDGSRFRTAMWTCRCDCGRTLAVPADRLRGGQERCAECLRERPRKKHGMTGSGAYVSWQAMLTRCGNSNAPQYRNYGARGVTVCERWSSSFENFLFDMGDRPPGTSLDRIDPHGNYEPGNCRWATRREQGRNKREHKLLPHEPMQIRWLIAEGFRQREVANAFNISPSMVRAVATGKSWSDD